jgi:hypothetical protein
MNTPSWKETLFANNKFIWAVDKFFEAARYTGYRYACWNGRIYELTKTGVEPTRWLEEDVL